MTASAAQAYNFTDSEKKITIIGMMIVFLLAALDQTIVSTAMPRIVTDLGGLSLYSWMITSYMLSSTVMIPIWGKLGDLYGRKPILLAGISIFLAGSWLSGLSGEFGDLPLLGGGMTQLISFRVVQGLGGGALFTTAFAIIADMFPPRERGRFAGLFGGMFGLASAIGPLIGGYFTDHGSVDLGSLHVAGWRWVFYLNLPLGLISLFMIIAKMPRLSHAAKGKIDWFGAVFVVAATIPLLLALTWGGNKYPWVSAPVLGLLAAFVVFTGLFIFAETRHKDPIIHLELFKNKVFTFANIAAFLSSMAFLSSIAFLPFFMQVGQGVGATSSGLTLMPLMLGLIVASVVSGQVVSKTGRYKPSLLVGVVVVMIGIFLLSRMTYQTTPWDLSWRMVILGIGLGPLQATFNIAIQNAIPVTQIGVVTAANQFFRQIGSTIGVALFGTLFFEKLRSHGMDVSKVNEMRAPAAGAIQLPDAVKEIIANSITSTFGFALIVLVGSLIAILLIPELPLRSMDDIRKARVADGDMPPDAHL